MKWQLNLKQVGNIQNTVLYRNNSQRTGILKKTDM